MENNSFSFNQLPKHIVVERYRESFDFRPVVFKYDNEGCPNAFFAMYAKFNYSSRRISTSKVLFGVCGSTYEEAVELLLQKFKEESSNIKNGEWVGRSPVTININNIHQNSDWDK